MPSSQISPLEACQFLMQGLCAILLTLFSETTYPGDKLTLTSTTKYALSATPLSTLSESSQLSTISLLCYGSPDTVFGAPVRMLAGP